MPNDKTPPPPWAESQPMPPSAFWIILTEGDGAINLDTDIEDIDDLASILYAAWIQAQALAYVNRQTSRIIPYVIAKGGD